MIVFTLNEEAAMAGGAKGGQYLQRIGVTDLATLNSGQWRVFCLTVVGEAFAAGMQDYIVAAEKEPPF